MGRHRGTNEGTACPVVVKVLGMGVVMMLPMGYR